MIAAKSIDTEIIRYLEHLNPMQKEAVLKLVETFAHEEDDWRDAAEGDAEVSIAIELKQAKEGAVVSHCEVMKKILIKKISKCSSTVC